MVVDFREQNCVIVGNSADLNKILSQRASEGESNGNIRMSMPKFKNLPEGVSTNLGNSLINSGRE